jgi:alpha-ketoglutarate-dependent taurine dioxygenase
LRFRRDILADPPSADPAANAAVEELNSLLDDPNTKGWRFSDDIFKENVVLFMDNARFLHMRSAILDKRRLLRRVRFHGQLAVN